MARETPGLFRDVTNSNALLGQHSEYAKPGPFCARTRMHTHTHTHTRTHTHTQATLAISIYLYTFLRIHT